VLVVLVVPYAVLATARFGLTGAASTWPLLNGLYLLAGAPPTLRRLLPGHGLRWLARDVVLPLGGAVAAASLARLVLPAGGSVPEQVASLAAAGLLAVAAVLATADRLRASLAMGLASWRERRAGARAGPPAA
jgi:hypothetical protein